MSEKKTGLKRHSAEEQKQYEREARLQYGPAEVNETIRRWHSYSKARQEAIKAEGERIYVELAEALEARLEANDERVREILERWRTHLRHFYEPSLDRLRGLGKLYNSHPDFIANFQRIHPELPVFLERGDRRTLLGRFSPGLESLHRPPDHLRIAQQIVFDDAFDGFALLGRDFGRGGGERDRHGDREGG